MTSPSLRLARRSSSTFSTCAARPPPRPPSPSRPLAPSPPRPLAAASSGPRRASQAVTFVLLTKGKATGLKDIAAFIAFGMEGSLLSGIAQFGKTLLCARPPAPRALPTRAGPLTDRGRGRARPAACARALASRGTSPRHSRWTCPPSTRSSTSCRPTRPPSALGGRGRCTITWTCCGDARVRGYGSTGSHEPPSQQSREA
jgi:hypothetical protein